MASPPLQAGDTETKNPTQFLPPIKTNFSGNQSASACLEWAESTSGFAPGWRDDLNVGAPTKHGSHGNLVRVSRNETAPRLERQLGEHSLALGPGGRLMKRLRHAKRWAAAPTAGHVKPGNCCGRPGRILLHCGTSEASLRPSAAPRPAAREPEGPTARAQRFRRATRAERPKFPSRRREASPARPRSIRWRRSIPRRPRGVAGKEFRATCSAAPRSDTIFPPARPRAPRHQPEGISNFYFLILPKSPALAPLCARDKGVGELRPRTGPVPNCTPEGAATADGPRRHRYKKTGPDLLPA